VRARCRRHRHPIRPGPAAARSTAAARSAAARERIGVLVLAGALGDRGHWERDGDEQGYEECGYVREVASMHAARGFTRRV
jgi:hypothetical protein